MAKFKIEFYNDNAPRTIEADDYETDSKFVHLRRYDDMGILNVNVASFAANDVASVERIEG